VGVFIKIHDEKYVSMEKYDGLIQQLSDLLDGARPPSHADIVSHRVRVSCTTAAISYPRTTTRVSNRGGEIMNRSLRAATRNRTVAPKPMC
jgi:hypothetical protein